MLEQLKLPKEIAYDIAVREKIKRKQRKITQKQMSERTGISLGSIKRFEQSGEISFESLIKIADVLGELDAFGELFNKKEYSSIQEVIDENS